MTHAHSAGDHRPRASARATYILLACVGVIVAATSAGAALTWPSSWDVLSSEQFLYEGASWGQATVVSWEPEGEGAIVVVDGHEGTEAVQIPPTGDPTLSFEPGDRIRVVELPTGEVIFSDFVRAGPILGLLAAYIALVVGVAWWRGAGALLGLAGGLGVIVFYTIPALLSGGSPLIIALVTGAGAMFLLLYVAHGVNARTTTAYLGTMAGLAVTAVLGVWAVRAAHIPGVADEAQINLAFVAGELSLSGLALCGLIIAGLGVLNDITVAQSSAVWELRAARPDLSRWDIFRRAMRIGRDHIASTVYTIAFAYAGAALPLIMLVAIYDNPAGVALTSSEIAGEVIRTLVGSIGLVLAMPLTTAIGALVAGPAEGAEPLANVASDAD